MDCLDRDGKELSEKERHGVEEIVYAEVYFGEGDEDMDMTEIYQITLTQEVLTEKAAEILAKLFTLRSTARKQGDAMREMVFSDIHQSDRVAQAYYCQFRKLQQEQTGRDQGSARRIR